LDASDDNNMIERENQVLNIARVILNSHLFGRERIDTSIKLNQFASLACDPLVAEQICTCDKTNYECMVMAEYPSLIVQSCEPSSLYGHGCKLLLSHIFLNLLVGLAVIFKWKIAFTCKD